MGDWETDWSRDALKRIVILLFALANLADRAAGASFLRRQRVLGILSHGETEARAFVIGMVCDELVPADTLESSGDATHLAVRLRALALMLCLMLMRAGRAALPRMAGPRGRRERFAPAARPRPSFAPAPDTS